MFDEQAHTQPEFQGEQPSAAPKIEKNFFDIEAEHEAYQAKSDQLTQAEATEAQGDRQSQIELFLMENDLFGYEPYSPEVLSDLTDLLLQMETRRRGSNPEFDITTEWGEPKIIRYFERKYDNSDLETEDAGTKKQDEDYAKALIDIREQNPGITNVELCQALLRTPDKVPSTEITKLQAFITIQQMATTPEDQAIVTAKINAQDFSGGVPDPVAFVHSEIFSYPDHDSGLSEATQERIAAAMGIPRPPQIDTGSQAQDTLAQTKLDENGKTVPAWSEDQPLYVRPGVTMHADTNARQYLRTEYNGHITTIDTTGWKGEVVGKYLEALSFVHDVEQEDATGLLHSIYQIDFNLMGNEGFDMGKIDQILNTMGKIFGGLEHADGDVRQAGDRRGLIRYMARLMNKSGQVTGFQESQADTNEVIKELELHNPDGSPNWKQIDKLGDFVQMTYLTGDPSYEDLKAFLLGTADS